MSLDWRLTKIVDYKTVCWKADPEHPEDEERKRLNPVTESLIWATMQVGMGEITETNYQKFYLRLSAIEEGFGAFLQQMQGEEIKDRFITLGEVQQHIGLSTNARTLTDSQFKRSLADRLIRRAEERLKKQ